MDTRARTLSERQLAHLVTLTGLDGQRALIHYALGTLLDAIADVPPPPARSHRTLTRSGCPVEFGVTVDRNGALGLKYTVDLSTSSRPTDALETVQRARARLVSRYSGARDWQLLDQCASNLLQRVARSDVAVYWSVGFAQGADPRMRMHLIGPEGAFGPVVLRSLASWGCDLVAIDAMLRAAEAVGRSSINFIGLGIDGAGRLRCKAYLGANLYIDLRLLTRLASALGLSTGRALALMRWYRHFIGDHVGQLGAFGVGVDLTAPPGRGAIEAYAYPGNVDLAGLRRRIDALVRRRAHESTLTRLWALLDGDAGSPAGMYLAGCGTDTATFARFGPITLYLGISPEAPGSCLRS